MISKIEVSLRVRLVESLLIHREPLVLQDSSIFKDKKLYWQNMSTIASEIARSNDVFIKHNFNNHDGEVPVWAIVEVLSFGTLSKIIKNLKTGTGSSYSVLAANYQYKSQKGNLVNPSKKCSLHGYREFQYYVICVPTIREYTIEQYILHQKSLM